MIVWGGLGTSDDGGMYISSYVDADHDGWPACTVDCDDTNPAVHPTAAEVCNAIDDDCDGVVDETFDNDQDGVTSCAGDCNDADPSLWGRPGETRSLLVSKYDTTATGTWTAPVNTGTSSCCGWPLFSYDVLASSSPSVFGASSCIEARVNAPAFEDPVVPALGEARYYLTRAQNPCGYGSLGSDSGGTPRTAPACP
jgi:predicted lipoprotein with Yx(FWY)xxD motif